MLNTPAGTIFKRFDSTKLFVMTCQDVVERFHLCLSLLFVVAEEMDNSSSWIPNRGLLWKCVQIFTAEVCIDVIKHAVLGKFNEIRPGVYREFLKVKQILDLKSLAACQVCTDFSPSLRQ